MNFRLVWMGPDDDPKEVRSPRAATKPGSSPPVRYEQRGTEMVRRKHLTSGRVQIAPIANFIARIVRDLVLDDGIEREREFVIEAEVDGTTVALVLSAAEFGRMGWVLRHLGPQAIIYPGQQQHARAAIQWLSSRAQKERIFTHLGWTKYGADWVYLQAGGAVGAQGLRRDIQVRLPDALGTC